MSEEYHGTILRPSPLTTDEEAKDIAESMKALISDTKKTNFLFDGLNKVKTSLTTEWLSDNLKVGIEESTELQWIFLHLIHFFAHHDKEENLRGLASIGCDAGKVNSFADKVAALDEQTERSAAFLMYANSTVEDVPHFEDFSAWYSYKPFHSPRGFVGLMPTIELSFKIRAGEDATNHVVSIPITEVGRIIKILEDAQERTRDVARMFKAKATKDYLVPEG